MIVYCDHCGSAECKGECQDYDFCEHCGSTDCEGECRKCPQCGKISCGCPKESPGAQLARKAQGEQDELHKKVSQLSADRAFPTSKTKIPECTVDEYEAELASKGKPREVYTEEGGFTFRRKPY